VFVQKVELVVDIVFCKIRRYSKHNRTLTQTPTSKLSRKKKKERKKKKKMKGIVKGKNLKPEKKRCSLH